MCFRENVLERSRGLRKLDWLLLLCCCISFAFLCSGLFGRGGGGGNPEKFVRRLDGEARGVEERYVAFPVAIQCDTAGGEEHEALALAEITREPSHVVVAVCVPVLAHPIHVAAAPVALVAVAGGSLTRARAVQPMFFEDTIVTCSVLHDEHTMPAALIAHETTLIPLAVGS